MSHGLWRTILSAIFAKYVGKWRVRKGKWHFMLSGVACLLADPINSVWSSQNTNAGRKPLRWSSTSHFTEMETRPQHSTAWDNERGESPNPHPLNSRGQCYLSIINFVAALYEPSNHFFQHQLLLVCWPKNVKTSISTQESYFHILDGTVYVVWNQVLLENALQVPSQVALTAPVHIRQQGCEISFVKRRVEVKIDLSNGNLTS